KNFKRTKNIVPVAQSQLTFVKPLETDIPRHPMPFAAKNMFYDEQWKEKQQRGFTWWLNFVLTPDDFTLKTDISQVNAACLILGTETYKTSVPKAPTKEEASLRAYTTRCKLNKLRRSACRLFTCDEMVKAIKRLEIEIEAKRLLVRKDRHLWKDIGERQKILNWLLCYNPLWLRIGLETIFGELIALESNSDVMGLAVFILNRLLWNPDIAAEYRHPTVPHFYRDGHEEALSKFTLKKLLLLVCFLDRAKVSRIIEHDPCLFFKNAEFKSSKEILLAFSRDFLSGEGDLSRHLGFLGFPVNHIQTPLDEFDFAVTNLATDLQCGIRLVRTLELLSSDWTLSKKLRVPAISRLQKMYNVKLAFEILNNHGIQLKDEHGSTIDTKDIVDRHREKTFALLWKIVFAFQVNISLDMDQLKAEIAFLKNMQVTKLKRHDVECVNRIGNDTSRSYSHESYGENVKLLMDWVNVVCGFYNIKVENFTVSFSDGRVLCYLIHHYHPCYVPLEAVCKLTTQTIECTRSGTLGMNSSSESDASLNLINGTFDQSNTSVLYKELLDNEKRNFQLINAAVSDLGGVPAMIQHSDMSNTIPDEKVVIIYVSFLCSRLINLSKEIRAAQLIQSAWRKYRLKKLIEEAAILLQRNFKMQRARKNYLALKAAAISLQKRYRATVLSKQQHEKFLNLCRAVIIIQSTIRGLLVRRYVKQMHLAAAAIQATFRMHITYTRYRTMKSACVVIQHHYRTYQTAKQSRDLYLRQCHSVLILQAAYRGMKVRHMLKKKHEAAVVLQSNYRKHRQWKSYKNIQWAIRLVQARVRANQERKAAVQQYCSIKKATICIQKAFRRMKARNQRRQEAAILLQRNFKMQRARKNYLALKAAAISFQRKYRALVVMRRQTKEYASVRKKIICLQSFYRGFKIRKEVKRQYLAAIVIQALWRGYSWRKKTDTPETRSLRDSLIIANKESKEEKKLYHRTSVAIDYLLKYKHFSYILAALKDLEVVTRLSPVCCENMAQSKAVCTIFTLIRSCNRSVPSMDVIKYSVQILLNLSKYERTTDAVYSVENSVETLLDLLQMYRERAGDKTSEKSGSIFTKTCCLFAHLSKDSRRASEIRNSHKTVASLRRLFRLTARKHQMDVQRMLAKQKKVAYITGQSSIPVKTKIVSRQRPDWDLRKDNIREIVDPLQAIEMVVNTLGISCN
uniref:Assembly factor for spindle microtubules n=1 Tax=Laticauda laticaudata TaxID=8630 RepID=A0A8C5WY97_LATLA